MKIDCILSKTLLQNGTICNKIIAPQPSKEFMKLFYLPFLLSLIFATNAIAQIEDPSYGAFEGTYVRKNVSGIYGDGKLIIHQDGELQITKDGGTYRMDSTDRCFNKQVPIEVIKTTAESITIRLKFSSIASDCKEYDIRYSYLIENGKVGLTRVGYKVFEFEKTDRQPQNVNLEPTITPNPIDGQYEIRNFIRIKNDKANKLADANLTIAGNKGIYRFINAAGKCYSKPWPVDVIQNGELFILNFRGGSIYPDCKDHSFVLKRASIDGHYGLAFDGDNTLAYKKTSQ